MFCLPLEMQLYAAKGSRKKKKKKESLNATDAWIQREFKITTGKIRKQPQKMMEGLAKVTFPAEIYSNTAKAACLTRFWVFA